MKKEDGLERYKKYEIDGIGRKFKTPVEERVKKSKFAEIISEMGDDELKALAVCIFGSQKVKTALKYMDSAVENGVQIYALEQELKKRIKFTFYEEKSV